MLDGSLHYDYLLQPKSFDYQIKIEFEFKKVIERLTTIWFIYTTIYITI